MTLRELLYSSEGMAWSFAGRKHGTEHDPRIALAYAAKIEALIVSKRPIQAAQCSEPLLRQRPPMPNRQPSFVQPQLFHWRNDTENKAR